ncbi:MAG TPA: hypothetical protein VF748_17335 [Candidatus Acidoferrum sp.]
MASPMHLRIFELGHMIGYDGSGDSLHRSPSGLQKAWWVMVPTNQKDLTWTEIGVGKTLPTLWLQKLDVRELQAQGRSFSYEEVKEYSQKNRETRLSAPAK